VTVVIRYHIPFAQPFFVSNISNGRKIKIIYSRNKIKAPLERKYDPKHELIRNTEENGDDMHCFGTKLLTKELLLPLSAKQVLCAAEVNQR
jgi:hypothetical protein